MTSSLASQLAQIRAQGANPLDLKAQKKAHSQSLLFDARVAATQDFETLFWLCHEGFQDLCRLDSRFAAFGQSIFSEQSKQADRTQMTALQNSELDKNLESFLGMVGGKLLLKPALKAVEWLIRRFRIHENNTVYLVLTFLPYHLSPIFPTLLSILPKTLPPTLRFLHPYIESLASPPRHTIIYTASHNPKFSTVFNGHVLDLCRSGYHYPAICSFWATVTTESIAATLDHSRSGKHKIQKESQEALMLRIMPTLNKGLAMETVPDLQIGCYMVLTVLATKVALSDIVLNAAMEAVVLNWGQITAPGLICLATLAEQREGATLPHKVLNALLELERLEEDLMLLKTQYRVDNIALGVLLGVLERLDRSRNSGHVGLLRTLLESELMEKSHLTAAIAAICAEIQKPEKSVDGKIFLTNLLYSLAENKNLEPIIESITDKNGPDLPRLKEKSLTLLTAGNNADELQEEATITEQKKVPNAEAFKNAVRKIPKASTDDMSFLAYASSNKLFDHLSGLFILASSAADQSEAFSNLPVLRKPLSKSEPFFLSFFVRFWCSSAPAMARAVAINATSDYIISEKLDQDIQMLFPYVLHGLADPSVDVRRASTRLVMTLGRIYKDEGGSPNRSNKEVVGRDNLYGRVATPSPTVWLAPEEAPRFFEYALLTDLEESLLDPDHISKHLSRLLRGSKGSRGSVAGQRELKTSTRQAFFAFICSHTICTALYRVRYRLLQILCQIDKVGSLSRTKALLPLLLEYADQAQENLAERCMTDQIEPVKLLEQVVEIVLPTDREGVEVLQTVIEAKKAHQSTSLFSAAIARIQRIWPSMKHDLQLSISGGLFELAVGQRAFERSGTMVDGALETLRTVPLSTSILQSFLAICLDLFKNFQNDTNVPKRRRTAHGSITATSYNAEIIVKRLATTLELVEASKPEKHPELMKGLFQILAELQQSKNLLGTEMGYIQVIALESIHAMVKEFENSTVSKIDKSAIRPDVIVESIRTTASAQVQHVALLLISSLATVSPESVLHSVMPIFTFMGAGLLRQNDDYSVYVVDRTMESVIPRLAASLQKQKQDPMVGVSELILSFVAAFEHIPSQRRLELFKSLADKLDAPDYLFALLIILLDKHANDKKTLEFAADLAGLYDIETQFQTIEKYLSVISDILKPKPSISEYLVSVARPNTGVAVANLLPLTSVILKKKRLISKTRESLIQDAENDAPVRVLYERVVEMAFVLRGDLRHDRTLEALCQQNVDSLLGLPPISDFTRIIRRLLEHTRTEVRMDVLKLFQQRLSGDLVDQVAAQKSSLAVLPQLSSILEESNHLPLKHAALTSVDLVVGRFGKQDLPAALAAARIVSRMEILGAGDPILQIAALLCLATTVEVLKDMFTPLVPFVFPKSLEYLSLSLQKGGEDLRLHNAAYSFIKALLSSTPWILTDSYLEQLLSVSYESADSGLGKGCDQIRSDALKVLAKQVDPQLCFTALDRTWETAMNKGPIAVKEHLEVLRIAIEQQPKSSIVKYSSILTGIYIKLFDLRRVESSSGAEESFTEHQVEEIEQTFFNTAITMIYKLSDATFRPMFRKILAWSNDSRIDENGKGSMYRQTTLYTFLGIFFGNLKSIVTSYAGLIIEDSAKILQNIQVTDDKSILLGKRIITTLHKAFEHDQDDFWQSPSHFTPIADALLQQFHHAASIPMTSETIPALTELVVAADSTTHHKQLNSAILRYMRSDKPAIRLAAVQCEQSLTDRLGEEWLAHLPEMLPFISELVEDDDEAVERATHAWIRKIESVLGESVRPMLQ